MLNFKNIVVFLSLASTVSAGVWGTLNTSCLDASTGTVQYLVDRDLDAATGTVQYLVNNADANADAATGTVQYKTRNILSRCDG